MSILKRKLGVENVKTTKETDDEGIYGEVILKLGGGLLFHVLFQAKRYSELVGIAIIRDFRSIMVGR